jgi:hypothetical protein
VLSGEEESDVVATPERTRVRLELLDQALVELAITTGRCQPANEEIRPRNIGRETGDERACTSCCLATGSVNVVNVVLWVPR